MIVIVDYDMGNLGSIQNMLKKIGYESIISSDPDLIRSASKLILPGVGSFDTGMRNLAERKLIDVLNECAMEKKTPILGICLGMQLMTQSSAEGSLKGLGWFKAKTIRFEFKNSEKLKIPHMGWNIAHINKESDVFKNMLNQENRFYFVHSYYVVCEEESDILTTTNYGINFTSAIQRANLFATQFHPEKSHKFGMALLRNFMELK